MRNIVFKVMYDGSSYHGFQDQGDGKPTIQACLETAIQRLTGERLRVIGAGRTDAGVHAVGQVVNVHTEATIPLDRWAYAMNAVLPRDIVVYAACEGSTAFHARYQAIGKTYRYLIDNGTFPRVFLRKYAYHVREPLDTESMSVAAAAFCGTHSFAAFRSTGSSAQTTERTISQCDVRQVGSLLTVDVTANGFLYNMVRIITGTLLEIGRGRLAPGSVKTALQSGDRTQAGPTAPPHGLCLLHVYYPDNVFAAGNIDGTDHLADLPLDAMWPSTGPFVQ